MIKCLVPQSCLKASQGFKQFVTLTKSVSLSCAVESHDNNHVRHDNVGQLHKCSTGTNPFPLPPTLNYFFHPEYVSGEIY